MCEAAYAPVDCGEDGMWFSFLSQALQEVRSLLSYSGRISLFTELMHLDA